MKKSINQTYRAVAVRDKATRDWRRWEESGPRAVSPSQAGLSGSEVGGGGGRGGFHRRL